MVAIAVKILQHRSVQYWKQRLKLPKGVTYINLLLSLKDGWWNAPSPGSKSVAVYGKIVNDS